MIVYSKDKRAMSIQKAHQIKFMTKINSAELQIASFGQEILN